MAPFEPRDRPALQPWRLLADGPEEPGVRALIGAHSGGARLLLEVIPRAVGLLPLHDRWQDQPRTEAARQGDENARPPAGLRRQVGHPGLAQLRPPDFGVALL